MPGIHRKLENAFFCYFTKVPQIENVFNNANGLILAINDSEIANLKYLKWKRDWRLKDKRSPSFIRNDDFFEKFCDKCSICGRLQ